MNITLHSMETMQADHERWDQWRRIWQRDAGRWQTDLHQLALQLAEWQTRIREQEKLVAQHVRSLHQEAQLEDQHERQIADFHSGIGTAPQDVWGNRHQAAAAEFARLAQEHEKLERAQTQLLSELP